MLVSPSNFFFESKFGLRIFFFLSVSERGLSSLLCLKREFLAEKASWIYWPTLTPTNELLEILGNYEETCYLEALLASDYAKLRLIFVLMVEASFTTSDSDHFYCLLELLIVW